MPRFDLERVQAAARAGDVHLTKTRALDHLMPPIQSNSRCYEFAKEVAFTLRAGDYYETIEQEDICDVYGVELPIALLERFGFSEECRTWYVKITIVDGDLADGLFFISLHALEREMEAYVEGAARGRKAGPLRPSW